MRGANRCDGYETEVAFWGTRPGAKRGDVRRWGRYETRRLSADKCTADYVGQKANACWKWRGVIAWFLRQQSNLSAIEELRDPLMKSEWKPEHEYKGEDLSAIRYGEGSRGSRNAGGGGALCSVKLASEAW